MKCYVFKVQKTRVTRRGIRIHACYESYSRNLLILRWTLDYLTAISGAEPRLIFCSFSLACAAPQRKWRKEFTEKPHKGHNIHEIQCLESLNWTIFKHFSHLCPGNFPTFPFSYWGANSYYPRGLIIRKGDSSNFKMWWDRVVSVPGPFKLDHLQLIEPILFQKIFNFFTFILGGQFLLPQRANNGKRGFIQLQNWMRQRGFSAWGIQTGPFAAHWAHFVPKDFQLFHLHTGRPILITPED